MKIEIGKFYKLNNNTNNSTLKLCILLTNKRNRIVHFKVIYSDFPSFSVGEVTSLYESDFKESFIECDELNKVTSHMPEWF